MGKRIPQNKVEEIYAVADVVDILGEFLELKKRGSNFFALSPFTNEKTPSLAVSPSKNIFKDFSTGKGGNAVTFLMEAEGMSFVESLKWIAERYGIDLEMEETEDEGYDVDKRDSLYILNDFAARYFKDILLKDEQGRRIGLSYFKERGILESTIETFSMGYALDEWDNFSKAALQKQFKEDYLVETGLAFRSKKDQKLLDRFKGRVMFPIHNHLGKIVGFGGRILGNKEKMAKYVNSPESDVYHKSRILYGLYQCKGEIRNQDQCILVEGYMDVVSLYQAGIKNVVASSGTALTEEQIRLIKRFTENVLLIYDSDRAGINAALRGVDLLIEKDMAVKVLLLPQGQDPDSYVKEHGKSGFDTYVKEKAADFIDFKIGHLMTELPMGDPQAMAQLIHEAASTIARIPDNVKQDVYLGVAAKRIGVKVEVMQKALDTALGKVAKQAERKERFDKLRQDREGKASGGKAPPPEGEQALIKTEYSAQEFEVFRIILNHHDGTLNFREEKEDGNIEEEVMALMDYVIHELGPLEFDTPFLEKFRKELFEQYGKKGTLALDFFINHPDEKIAKVTQSLLTIPYEVSENWGKFDIKAPTIDQNLEEAVTHPILYFKLSKLRKLVEANREKIKEITQKEGKKANSSELDRLLMINTHLEKMQRNIYEARGFNAGLSATDTSSLAN